MTHPMIPPNCDWFFKETMQKGTYGFELFDRDFDDWWPLPDLDELEKAASWRKIIAAVARCAFIDIGDMTNADKWKAWGNSHG